MPLATPNAANAPPAKPSAALNLFDLAFNPSKPPPILPIAPLVLSFAVISIL